VFLSVDLTRTRHAGREDVTRLNSFWLTCSSFCPSRVMIRVFVWVLSLHQASGIPLSASSILARKVYNGRSQGRNTKPVELKHVRRSTKGDCQTVPTNKPVGLPRLSAIRNLTEIFDSKLADAENPLFRQLGRHLCQPRVG
jgi:hypothetical protein